MTDNEPRLIAKLRRAEISDRFDVLCKSLDSMLRDVLKISKDADFSYETTFSELGLTSASAVIFTNEILDSIGEDYGVTVASSFDHPSVKSLATFMASQIKIEEL